MPNPIQVLLVSGSIRQLSYTRTLTNVVEAALVKHRALTQHYNLRDVPLPIADPQFHHNPIQNPDSKVQHLVTHAVSCDAFVLASPIYHNSYSGVLKNALDHLAIPQFQNKPVGLISHGGNRSPQAVDHLRIVVRGLLGVAIPTQVCTASQDYAESAHPPDLELRSEDVLQRVERFVIELIMFAHQFRLLRESIQR
jgi:azobenzene reductase